MTKVERWFRNVRSTWRLSKQFIPFVYRAIREAEPGRGDAITVAGVLEVFPKLVDGLESL